MRPRTRHTDALETEPLLLLMDAPARVARWTAWLFLAVLAAALVFACTVRLPETVSASFVLEPGQGHDPLVRLTVPESAFPRLKPGQEARLSYNAYPSQRYGSAVAILEHISPAALDSQEGTGLPATAILQAGPRGHPLEPQPGMRGEAQIIVGRNTLLERLFGFPHGTPDQIRR